MGRAPWKGDLPLLSCPAAVQSCVIALPNTGGRALNSDDGANSTVNGVKSSVEDANDWVEDANSTVSRGESIVEDVKSSGDGANCSMGLVPSCSVPVLRWEWGWGAYRRIFTAKPPRKTSFQTLKPKKENGCVCGAPFGEAFDGAADGGGLGWFSSAE